MGELICFFRLPAAAAVSLSPPSWVSQSISAPSSSRCSLSVKIHDTADIVSSSSISSSSSNISSSSSSINISSSSSSTTLCCQPLVWVFLSVFVYGTRSLAPVCVRVRERERERMCVCCCPCPCRPYMWPCACVPVCLSVSAVTAWFPLHAGASAREI